MEYLLTAYKVIYVCVGKQFTFPEGKELLFATNIFSKAYGSIAAYFSRMLVGPWQVDHKEL